MVVQRRDGGASDDGIERWKHSGDASLVHGFHFSHFWVNGLVLKRVLGEQRAAVPAVKTTARVIQLGQIGPCEVHFTVNEAPD